MSDSKTIDKLNELIEISKDGEYGFRASAEHVKSAELQQLLSARAQDCADAARELQDLVVTLGGEPDQGGSTGGAFHRGWVSVRSALTGHTDLAVLEECERGEDKALARYRDALKEPLPPSVQVVIERQLQGAQANHDQIRDLRNQLRATA
jgi:uncharacterized protein (TIGR02284 family)